MIRMSSKKNRKQVTPVASSSTASSPPWILIGGVLVVTVLAVFTLYPTSSLPTEDETDLESETVTETSSEPTSQPISEPETLASQPSTPKPPPNAILPPLPSMPGFTLPRPAEAIADAYAFAALNPDVLEFVPCFCGCERSGHRGNADCFVQSRNADGSVKTWDTHGMACTVCIDVALDSAQLRRSGASVRDVRAAIENKYEPRFSRKTPTPQPH
jgi:hypothetical protein